MSRCPLLLLCLLWVLMLNRSFGQAYFELRNYHGGATGLDAPVYDSLGNPLEGSGYLAELWGAATPESLAPALDDRSLQRAIVPFQTGGYFFGGGVMVPSVPRFSYAWLQVRAWAAGLGGTYEEVEALGIGGYGESPLFYAQGTDASGSPPHLPAPLIGLESFSLRPIVPEPSGFALFGLGAVAFLVAKHTVDRLNKSPNQTKETTFNRPSSLL